MMATASRPLQQLLKSTRGSLWEVCIGLEVHAQVLSQSKLMSGSPASLSAAAQPNRNVSFFDAALPGTLPVVNRACVHQAIRTSLAVGATVHPRSVFERKHYFYCDLPLGYQLTQQRAPIATQGVLHFDLPSASIVNEADTDDSEDAVDAVFDGSKYKNRKEKNEALKKWKDKQQARKAAHVEVRLRLKRKSTRHP
jgi:aspartyl-tRNA(Asn)/glutamyl-tRNA(Gln) amidotransferase subunit B